MKRGFTLVEVVVALVVLEICVVGVAGLLTLCSRTVRQAESLEVLVAEAEGVLDSLRTTTNVQPGTKAVPGGEISWWLDGDGELVLAGALEEGTSALGVRFRLRVR